MNKDMLWSLRLGFSANQAQTISDLGLTKFLLNSFEAKTNLQVPDILNTSPKTIAEFKELRLKMKDGDPDVKKELRRAENKVSLEMKALWIERMRTEKLPLREKMSCFWHNHYVTTFQKVKVNYYIFQHYQTIQQNAFGNYKDLTKSMIKSNAMVRYLDNVDNKKGKNNENLSRELLELFTLGIGNYSELDVKNGAKALAGLGLGDIEAHYRKIFEDNDDKTYFGKTGNFKSDDLVDIIFEQKEIPYLITRKLLQWFIYDTPDEDLVVYYGNYFREINFEIKPLLLKIFTEEYVKDNAGSKIKNPLEYILQLLSELHLTKVEPVIIANFIKGQGMDLFNQSNVKGWIGGKSWLTSQIYLQRNNAADLLCNAGKLNRDPQKANQMNDDSSIKVNIKWDENGNNKQIISQLKDRLLFTSDEAAQKDFETILKYDFDPKAENANQAVVRLFNAMVKMPEFQLI